MQVQVEVNGKIVAAECPNPKCSPKDRPDPRLIESGRFSCPACEQEFVALNPTEYADAITATRPALLVGEILRRL